MFVISSVWVIAEPIWPGTPRAGFIFPAPCQHKHFLVNVSHLFFVIRWLWAGLWALLVCFERTGRKLHWQEMKSRAVIYLSLGVSLCRVGVNGCFEQKVRMGVVGENSQPGIRFWDSEWILDVSGLSWQVEIHTAPLSATLSLLASISDGVFCLFYLYLFLLWGSTPVQTRTSVFSKTPPQSWWHWPFRNTVQVTDCIW